MPIRRKHPIYAAGIIERTDNHILIVLPKGGASRENSDDVGSDASASRLWQFPRGLVQEKESPEAAMRRIIDEQFGLDVEVVVGQPPLRHELEGKDAELRYFFCGCAVAEPTRGDYEEVRWVPKTHLLEYDFEPASSEVAKWVAAERS